MIQSAYGRYELESYSSRRKCGLHLRYFQLKGTSNNTMILAYNRSPTSFTVGFQKIEQVITHKYVQIHGNLIVEGNVRPLLAR